MSVQLAILGFLREKDFYGYELKKVMERFMGDWTDIKFGSIYYALERLAHENLVEPVRREKEGSNPARTVYRITDKGRAAFLVMLEENLTKIHKFFMPLDMGLFFGWHVDRNRMVEILRGRAEMMKATIQFLTDQKSFMARNPHLPEIVMMLEKHQVTHLQAEYEYLIELAAFVETRDLYEGKTLGDFLEVDIEFNIEGQKELAVMEKEFLARFKRKENQR